MRSPGRTLLFGFLVWLVPFAVACSIYKPLHETQRDIFENTMGFVVVSTTVLFTHLHFRKLESGFVREGILAGVMWMAISLGLDLLMFSWGPMARPIGEYLKDIGMAYLVIPVVTAGCGVMVERREVGDGASRER